MPAAQPKRFTIRVDSPFRLLLAILGGSPKNAFVELDDDCVRVQLGWMFRSEFPRSFLHGARRGDDIKSWLPGIGAHGGRGRWLVNGSTKGIVHVDVEPHQARLYKFFPVKVHSLSLSLEDPDGFLAEVNG